MATKKRPLGGNLLAQNRHARHEYEILETFEAGLELQGTEVKSLRTGRANLREGYVRIENGQAWLMQTHVSPYEQGNRGNHEPERRRRLLLHRREIEYLDGKVRLQGLTLVPLDLHLRNNRIKLEIGLARGRKLWDKRQAIAERDSKREAERVAARARRGDVD